MAAHNPHPDTRAWRDALLAATDLAWTPLPPDETALPPEHLEAQRASVLGAIDHALAPLLALLAGMQQLPGDDSAMPDVAALQARITHLEGEKAAVVHGSAREIMAARAALPTALSAALMKGRDAARSSCVQMSPSERRLS